MGGGYECNVNFMIVIQDNFLSETEHANLFDLFITRGFAIDRDQWYDRGSLWFADLMTDESRKYFSFENDYIGYEVHANTAAVRPHRDKDELLARVSEGKEILYPLVGIVYYLKVTADNGGELVFLEDGVTVIPKNNRLVIFQRDLLHGVNPILKNHQRISIGINPWNKLPLAYQPSNANFITSGVNK